MMNNIFFVTLGCDKNRVDSEEMLALIQDAGYNLVTDEREADAIIINTCCFIDAAKEESIETILEMAAYKEDRCKALVVAGCMAQRYSEEILKEMPEVDALVGTTSFDEIAKVLDRLLKEKSDEEICIIRDKNRNVEGLVKRVITTPWHYAYLKIAEGCDKNCTYCVIPSIRGHYRSFPMDELVKKAEDLVANGVSELILVAQETTVYGEDIYGEKSLHILLRKLSEIENLKWIRVLYCYPEEIYDELIKEMAENKKVLHYIDMPIQHCNDDILRRMGRRIRKAGIIEVVNKLRAAIPDISIRTSLITGFPGEDLKAHNELIDFLKEEKLTHVGVFTYSQEEGTPAAGFENQIPSETAEKWREELMLTQSQIVEENLAGLIGKKVDCIIDGYMYNEDVYVGRTYMDAPDVDSLAFIKSNREIMSGDLCTVEIESVKGYDLIGKEVNDESTK